MNLSIGSLKANRQEVDKAAGNGTPLTASIFGTRVYYQSRFWRLFYRIFAFFGCKSFQEKKVAQALKKTDEAFQTYKRAFDDYQSYIEGKKTNVKQARRIITHWCAASITGVAEQKRYHRLVKLEAKMQQPLPTLKTLKPFFEKAKLTNRELHKVICDLHFLFTKEEDPLAVAKLEKTLDLPCFSQEDPKHKAWSSRLKEGDLVSDFLLGKELLKEDDYRLFNLRNDRHHLFMTGLNCASLPLQKLTENRSRAGLRPAKIQKLDPKGRFALVEKLQTCERKRAHAGPIGNYLKWLVQEELSLSPLNTKHLLFDEEGVLKCSPVCKQVPFDFNAIEAFIKDFSQDDHTLFQTLMKKSGLLEHRIYRCYRTLITRVLDGQTPNVIDDPHILENAEALIKATKAQKERILRAFPQAKEALKVPFLHVYETQCTASFFWPTFAREVMHQLANITNVP